ncbi:hypothetical protein [Streptomyces sp. NPDC054783]
MDGVVRVGGDLFGEGWVDAVGQQAHLMDGIAAGGVGKQAACFPEMRRLAGSGCMLNPASPYTTVALPSGRPVSAASARTAGISVGPGAVRVLSRATAAGARSTAVQAAGVGASVSGAVDPGPAAGSTTRSSGPTAKASSIQRVSSRPPGRRTRLPRRARSQWPGTREASRPVPGGNAFLGEWLVMVCRHHG